MGIKRCLLSSEKVKMNIIKHTFPGITKAIALKAKKFKMVTEAVKKCKIMRKGTEKELLYFLFTPYSNIFAQILHSQVKKEKISSRGKCNMGKFWKYLFQPSDYEELGRNKYSSHLSGPKNIL